MDDRQLERRIEDLERNLREVQAELAELLDLYAEGEQRHAADREAQLAGDPVNQKHMTPGERERRKQDAAARRNWVFKIVELQKRAKRMLTPGAIPQPRR